MSRLWWASCLWMPVGVESTTVAFSSIKGRPPARLAATRLISLWRSASAEPLLVSALWERVKALGRLAARPRVSGKSGEGRVKVWGKWEEEGKASSEAV